MIRSIVDSLYRKRLRESDDQVEDYDLILAFQENGDNQALEELMSRHQDLIKKMTKRYFLKSGDQDDLEQTALIGFWKAVSDFNGKGDFEAFAGMYIKRQLVDAVRKDSSGKEELNQLAKSMDATVSDNDGNEMTFGDTLKSKSLSPEEEFFSKEGVRELKNFMNEKLSSTEKEVIFMYIKGAKLPEIAEELNMKYKSVENTMMRVRGKIKNYLKGSTNESTSVPKDDYFTEEEKIVLESVLNELKEEEAEESMKKELMQMWNRVQKRR